MNLNNKTLKTERLDLASHAPKIENSMKIHDRKRAYLMIALCLLMTVFIGFFVVMIAIDEFECGILTDLQSLMQQTLGIPFFSVSTYLGDFYLWVIVSITFLIYTYYHSREKMNISIELVVYLILITVSTYILKTIFARPRPSCIHITVYQQEGSFSFPSGHVSRGTGAFIILLGKLTRPVNTLLIVIATFLLSLSRMVLGVHFATDIFGAIFLSIAIRKITEITVHSHFKSR